jgi:hypothetical protein
MNALPAQRDIRFGAGLVWATLIAGPLVAAPAILATVTMNDDRAETLMASIPLAIMGGAVLAVLPNFFGSVALAALGRGNMGARLPVFWALIGAFAGLLLERIMDANRINVEPLLLPDMWLAVVGATSALLCRWGTRWPD